MRILWFGINGSYHTGYGNQTRLFVPAIEDANHDIRISSALYQYHTGIDGNNIINYASGRPELMGNDFVDGHYKSFNADCIISCLNSFICKPEIFEKFNWYPFVFCESKKLNWKDFSILKACKRPIAPTHYTEQLLKDIGYDPFYIPLAYDGSIYKPESKAESKIKFEKMLHYKLGNSFLVAMNGMNYDFRKNYGSALMAWAEFQKTCPNSVLYIHADKTGILYNGANLERISNYYGCKNVIYPLQYDYLTGLLPNEYLAIIYNASDLFLHTSAGEGFCLPMIEAQACGCPILSSRFAIMVENNKVGMAIEGVSFINKDDAEQFLIDPFDTARKLKMMHDVIMSSGEHVLKDQQFIAEQVKQFEIKYVMKYNMCPVLEQINKEIK